MTFELFSRVVLRNDIPAHSLKKGDVVTIVEAHSGVGTQEQGYSVEVFNATGETIAVVTLPESYLESLRSTEILHGHLSTTRREMPSCRTISTGCRTIGII